MIHLLKGVKLLVSIGPNAVSIALYDYDPIAHIDISRALRTANIVIAPICSHTWTESNDALAKFEVSAEAIAKPAITELLMPISTGLPRKSSWSHRSNKIPDNCHFPPT